MCPPELFVKGKALMPGFYFTAATTAAELDRLKDLLDVRLGYIEALLCYVQRCHLSTMSLARWMLSNCRSSWIPSHKRVVFSYHDDMKMPVTRVALEIKDQFAKARAIAEMLDNDHARTRVARAWVSADQAFRGLSHWKIQRLYLP
jgi:hypothetical protein